MTEPIIKQELPQNPAITQMLDSIAVTTGMPTKREAHATNLCVVCKRTITPEEYARWSPAGQREYHISGCCEPCFDKMFGDENEEED